MSEIPECLWLSVNRKKEVGSCRQRHDPISFFASKENYDKFYDWESGKVRRRKGERETEA